MTANEISHSRIFNHPLPLLYKAWSDPQHFKNWWGPNGFTNTFHEFDFREGGHWKFTMHGPEKGNYENECEFLDIVPMQRINWKRHSQPYFQIVATFEETGQGKSRLVFKMVFDTPEACAKLRPYVVDKNEENLDRLEAELQKMTL